MIKTMKNINRLSFLIIISVVLLSFGGVVLAQIPTATAGPDLYLSPGQNTTLQGSGYDPQGYQVSYYWTCNGGVLSNNNIAQPVYTAPSLINYNNQTSYSCTLTVTNNYGSSSSDSTIVYVNSNNNNSNNTASVQTTYATYISNFQATLNGTLSNLNSYATNYVYFQWGTTTAYGSESMKQSLGYGQSFMQNIENLNPGTTYHYRAAADGNYGTVYGQDMTFTTSGSNLGYSNNSSLSVVKQVINLSSGNLSWSSSTNASPSDVLNFHITLQANGQDVHNIVVRDALPATLVYKGSLSVSTSYTGDVTSNLYINTIPAGQIVTISYQAQVASGGNFNYGATTISNNAVITSTESGTQTDNATVVVSKSQVYGATSVSTGLTNNFLTDSFFLPLLLIIFSAWFYFSGEIYVFTDKLKAMIKR